MSKKIDLNAIADSVNITLVPELVATETVMADLDDQTVAATCGVVDFNSGVIGVFIHLHVILVGMARCGVGLVRGIALVFLTRAGFFRAAVLAGKGKQVLPGLLDLVGVVVLWVAALMTRAALDRGLAILVLCPPDCCLRSLAMGRPQRKLW